MTRECTECACTYTGIGTARGLCVNCYKRHQRHGTLTDFERLTYSGDELLTEWDLLRREGYDLTQAAERLGIKRKRLEKAIERAQRRKSAS